MGANLEEQPMELQPMEVNEDQLLQRLEMSDVSTQISLVTIDAEVQFCQASQEKGTCSYSNMKTHACNRIYDLWCSVRCRSTDID